MQATSYNWAELWPHMTPAEKTVVLGIINNFELPIWEPLTGPQTLAFESDADIIGYGGAAGGGKTDLAIGKALLQHSRIAVFRKNGTEHTAFVDRLEEVLGTRDGLNGKDGIWRLTVGKKKPRKVQIELGSVPNMGDERKYRGRPHDLKVFDEAAEIPEAQVRFLLAWLRTTNKDQRCQALLCFNPPTTAEGRWVIDFFAPWLKRNHPNPAKPGEKRYFAQVNDKDMEVADGRSFVIIDGKPCYDFKAKDHPKTAIIKPLSRTFIPAKVTDNPYYAEGIYMSQLQALPEPLRSQMLNGDFAAGMTDDVWQVIPTAWVEMAMARWVDQYPKPPMDSMGIDPSRGGKDKTVIARRHARWYDRLLKWPGNEIPDGIEVMGHVITSARDGAPEHIDVIGIGASPYDLLKQANQHVIGVDVRVKALGTDKSGKLRFKNLRSELAWKFREELDPVNNTGIMLPPDDELKADLTSMKWWSVGPVIYVESRDEIFDRIGRSADSASAVFLARLDTPKMPDAGGVNSGGNKPYNPYDNLNKRR